MNEMPREAGAFLDTARSCSRRSTHILMIVEVFSILLAAMLLNSARVNWTWSRIATARTAVLLWELHPPTTDERAQLLAGRPTQYRTRVLSEVAPSLREEIGSNNIRHAIDFVGARRFDINDLREHVRKLEDFRFQNVTTLPLPLTGVRVDVNALGIVAGLGFTILLGWLYLSLARERQNLAIAQRYVGASGIHVLCMESFFNPETCEPPLSGWTAEIRRRLPEVATIFPLILLSVIIGNDFLTIYKALRQSLVLTVVNTTFEFVFLAGTTYFAVRAVSEYRGMQKWWQDHRAQAGQGHPTCAST